MTDHENSSFCEQSPVLYVSENPVLAVHPFSLRDLGGLFAVIGRAFGLLVSAMLMKFRRRSSAVKNQSAGTTWQFTLLHGAALIMTLPVVAFSRLLPSRWRERSCETVFAESNRAALTVLGAPS